MADKTFRTFDDVTPDDLIGGGGRLSNQRVPPDLGEIPGLVNPADDAHVDGFRREVAGRPLIVEVGPGKGAFLVGLADRRKEALCVGFESRLTFCRNTLSRARKAERSNVRVVWGDARVTIPLLVEPGTAHEAYLLFPDPWWKKKHSRRRHGPLMAGVLVNALAPGGLMVLKSDVARYLEILKDVFIETGAFEPCDLPGGLPLTNREVKIIENNENVFAAAVTKK